VTPSRREPTDVETERGVIVSELADAADDPADVAQEAFARAAFGEDTPLGRPIGGTNETVTAVPRDAVWEHYRRTYASDTLVVAAAGAVDHDEVCERPLADLAAAGKTPDDQLAWTAGAVSFPSCMSEEAKGLSLDLPFDPGGIQPLNRDRTVHQALESLLGQANIGGKGDVYGTLGHGRIVGTTEQAHIGSEGVTAFALLEGNLGGEGRHQIVGAIDDLAVGKRGLRTGFARCRRGLGRQRQQ